MRTVDCATDFDLLPRDEFEDFRNLDCKVHGENCARGEILLSDAELALIQPFVAEWGYQFVPVTSDNTNPSDAKFEKHSARRGSIVHSSVTFVESQQAAQLSTAPGAAAVTFGPLSDVLDASSPRPSSKVNRSAIRTSSASSLFRPPAKRIKKSRKVQSSIDGSSATRRESSRVSLRRKGKIGEAWVDESASQDDGLSDAGSNSTGVCNGLSTTPVVSGRMMRRTSDVSSEDDVSRNSFKEQKDVGFLSSQYSADVRKTRRSVTNFNSNSSSSGRSSTLSARGGARRQNKLCRVRRSRRRMILYGRWEEQCRKAMEKLVEFESAKWFKAPVDPEGDGVPDYLEVIQKPMDFQTIRQKLDADLYTHPFRWQEDVRQVFYNAFTYHTEGNMLWNEVRELAAAFEEICKETEGLNPYAIYAAGPPPSTDAEALNGGIGGKGAFGTSVQGVGGPLNRQSTATVPGAASNRKAETITLEASQLRELLERAANAPTRNSLCNGKDNDAQGGELVGTSQTRSGGGFGDANKDSNVFNPILGGVPLYPVGTVATRFILPPTLIPPPPDPPLVPSNIGRVSADKPINQIQRKTIVTKFRELDVSYRRAVVELVKDELGIEPLLTAIDIRCVPHLDVLPIQKQKQLLHYIRILDMRQKQLVDAGAILRNAWIPDYNDLGINPNQVLDASLDVGEDDVPFTTAGTQTNGYSGNGANRNSNAPYTYPSTSSQHTDLPTNSTLTPLRGAVMSTAHRPNDLIQIVPSAAAPFPSSHSQGTSPFSIDAVASSKVNPLTQTLDNVSGMPNNISSSDDDSSSDESSSSSSSSSMSSDEEMSSVANGGPSSASPTGINPSHFPPGQRQGAVPLLKQQTTLDQQQPSRSIPPNSTMNVVNNISTSTTNTLLRQQFQLQPTLRPSTGVAPVLGMAKTENTTLAETGKLTPSSFSAKVANYSSPSHANSQKNFGASVDAVIVNNINPVSRAVLSQTSLHTAPTKPQIGIQSNDQKTPNSTAQIYNNAVCQSTFSGPTPPTTGNSSLPYLTVNSPYNIGAGNRTFCATPKNTAPTTATGIWSISHQQSLPSPPLQTTCADEISATSSLNISGAVGARSAELNSTLGLGNGNPQHQSNGGERSSLSPSQQQTVQQGTMRSCLGFMEIDPKNETFSSVERYENGNWGSVPRALQTLPSAVCSSLRAATNVHGASVLAAPVPPARSAWGEWKCKVIQDSYKMSQRFDIKPSQRERQAEQANAEI